MFESKLFLLLRSRKFWAALIGLISVLAVHFGGQEVAPELQTELIEAILWLVGIYSATTAYEDAHR